MADTPTYYIDESDLAAYIPADEITNNKRVLKTGSQETNLDRIIKAVCGMADG